MVNPTHPPRPQSPPRSQTIQLEELIKKCPPAPKKKPKSRSRMFGDGDCHHRAGDDNFNRTGRRENEGASPPSTLSFRSEAVVTGTGSRSISPPQISRLSLMDELPPLDSPIRAMRLFRGDDDGCSPSGVDREVQRDKDNVRSSSSLHHYR